MAFDKHKVQAQAQKYFIKGQTDKAIKEYLLLVEDDPNDMKSCQKLGDLYAKKGNNKEARKYYEQVADDFSKKCFYLKAIALYKQILKSEPGDLPLNLKLANLYHLQGLKTDAINQYRMVAATYEKSGKVVDALEVIAKMADIDAANVMIRIKLAERYVREGFKDKAVEHLLKAGKEYRKQSKLDDLTSIFEKFLNVSPGNKDILKELGAVYREKGENDKALAKMQQVIQADSDDMDALSAIAELHTVMGASDKAKSTLQHVLKVEPEQVKARNDLAAIYLEEGDQSKALSEYEMIVDLHLKDENFDDALQVIEGLREKMPEDDRVLGKLCEVRWIMKDTDKLIENYKEMAALYEKKGADDKSRDVYKRILELRPGDKEAKEKVAGGEGGEEEAVEAEAPSAEIAAKEGAALSRAEIKKILTEVDVYIKYGMEEKAEETLKAVLTNNPDNLEANLKLKDLFLTLKRTDDAVAQLMSVVTICQGLGEEARAVECLKETLKLKPGHKEASDLLESLAGTEALQEETGIFMETEIPDDFELEMEEDESEELTLEEPEEEVEEVTLEEPEEEIEEVTFEEASEEEIETVAEAEEEEEVEDLLEAGEEIEDLEEVEELLEVEPLDAEVLEAGEEVIEELVPLEEEVEEEFPTLDDIQPLGLADVDEMLEEVQFYIHQDLFDKARATVADILELDPGNNAAIEMVKNIDSLEAEKEEAEVIEEVEPLEEEFFDLSSELADEFAGGGEEGELLGFDDLFDSFKEGVAKQVSNEDSDTHYNLGIAYREMGLFEDAMNEFKTALNDPAKSVEANSMLGLCAMDKGAPEEAIDYFKAGLSAGSITKEGKLNMSYDLALAYKKAGRVDDAKVIFEEIYNADKTFRDVKREYVGGASAVSASEEEIPGMETVSEKDLDDDDDGDEPNKKDKVSYI